jgi:hypothetical protein
MYVGGLEVEEVEEGGVVHGGRGPRRGSRDRGAVPLNTECAPTLSSPRATKHSSGPDP